MRSNVVRVRAARESFLLLNPNSGRSSHEVAKAIAACRGVKKVFMTRGDFGFVVSTEENGKYNADKISRALRRISGITKAKTIRGHYVYACRARA